MEDEETRNYDLALDPNLIISEVCGTLETQNKSDYFKDLDDRFSGKYESNEIVEPIIQESSEMLLITSEKRKFERSKNSEVSDEEKCAKRIFKEYESEIDIKLEAVEIVEPIFHETSTVQECDELETYVKVEECIKAEAVCLQELSEGSSALLPLQPHLSENPVQLTDEELDLKSIMRVEETVGGERKFVCNWCGFSSNRPYLLKEHIQSKHLGIVYPCDECSHVASRLGDLKRHKDVIHNPTKFPCQACDYVANRADNLRQHRESKHDGGNHPCSECDYVASAPSYLKRHKQIKHIGVRYPCVECDYTATRSSDLLRHTRSKHTDVRYSCEHCSFTNKSEEKLKYHIASIHEGIKRENNKKGEFMCDQCDYVAGRPDHLKTHRESKHEGIRYPCSVCSYSASTAGDLRRHTKIVHEGFRYNCTYADCGYSTTRLSYLKQHSEKKHDSQRSLGQVIVDGNLAQNLTVKIKVEENSSGFPLDNNVALKADQVSDGITLSNVPSITTEGFQDGLMPENILAVKMEELDPKDAKNKFNFGHPCDQCDYVAGKPNHLKEHKAYKHEGIRHPCTLCKYSASTAGDLKRHTRCVHEGFKYRCPQPECTYACSRTSYLRVHNEKKHGIVLEAKKIVQETTTVVDKVLLIKREYLDAKLEAQDMFKCVKSEIDINDDIKQEIV